MTTRHRCARIIFCLIASNLTLPCTFSGWGDEKQKIRE